MAWAGAALKGTLPGEFPFSPWYAAIPAIITAMFIGPVEELGWRGFALPLLQRKFAPLWAGLILGAIWALWHIPAFLMSGSPQQSWSFGPFFFGVVALSVIMTAMFNASRGSILIPALFHFQANSPLWPDGQPWSNVGFMLLAAAVAWVNRQAMLSRNGAATELLFRDSSPATISARRAV
jgi:membrane protease YdiL (CAAX protease family)